VHDIGVVHIGAAQSLTGSRRRHHTTDDQADRAEPVDDPFELTFQIELATLADPPVDDLHLQRLSDRKHSVLLQLTVRECCDEISAA
jgi:hypothetical protein